MSACCQEPASPRSSTPQPHNSRSMRIDFASLQLFVTACRRGSITAAAAAHHIAASAVSRRLAEMEAASGVTLLERSKRGVAPTAAGQALLARAEDMLRLADRIDGDLADFSTGVRGTVRLAANTSAVTQYLPDDLAGFGQAHPDVRIELRELVSGDIVAAVSDGLSDLGIAASHVPMPGLQSRPYRQDELVAVVPSAHPLAGRAAVRMADMADIDFIALQGESSLRNLLQAEAARLGGSLAIRVEMLSFDAIRRMVAAGLGITVLPRGAVDPYLDRLAVTALAIEEVWATRQLMLIARDFTGLSPAARALSQTLAG